MTSHALMARPVPRPAPRSVVSTPGQWPLPLGRSVPLAREADSTALRDRAAHFVRAVLEVLAGERPLNQLAGSVSGEVYDALVDRLGRTAGRRRRGRDHVASVHVAMVTPTGAEVTARVVRHGRSRAVAIRLDLLTDLRGKRHWRCTTLTWI